MFCRRAASAILFLIFLLAPSCGDQTAPGFRRVAVIHFENLTGSRDFDWVGPLLADIVVERFRGAADARVERFGSARGAADLRPTHILQGYFDVRAGACVLTLSLEDAAGRASIAQRELRGTLPGDIAAIAVEVAGLLGVPPREFGTSNPEAMHGYGRALVEPDVDQRVTLLEEALERDGGFTQAANRLASLLANRGEQERAKELLTSVAESSSADPIATAQAQRFMATIDGAAEAAVEATVDYAHLAPADSGVAEQAALSLLRLKRYGEAAEWYRRAAAIAPGRTDLWNSAAYPLAYAGDFEGAVAALERYQQAEPGNPNTYDSLGEIHFRFGRFGLAEEYFLKAVETDPAFQGAAALVKAARCRLYSGDRDGADELFEEYAAGRRDLNDPAIGLRKAQWLYRTGRRSEALAAIDSILEAEDAPPVVAALGYGQLAFWAIESEDTGAAGKYVENGRQILPGGAVDRATLICQLLLRHAEAPDAWRQISGQAEAHPAREALQKEVQAYAHLLAGRFGEAIPLIEERISKAPALGEDEWNVLLAWAALETGDIERAGELLATNPIIQPAAEDAFHGLVFPRILYLRGAVAARGGRRDEAEGLLRLFVSYSGDSPDASGDVASAKRLLAPAVPD